MNADLRAILSENYELRYLREWTAVFTRIDSPTRKAKSVRIGKLMKNGEFQFTVAGLAESRTADLVASIERILKAENLETFRRTTTSGSRGVNVIYPAFNIEGVSAKTVGAVVDHVTSVYRSVCR